MRVDPYKYHTKEQYEKYGDILETAEQIEARINKHKRLEWENKRQAEIYSQEWAERIAASRSESKNSAFEQTYYTKLYYQYNRPEPDFI
jgi:ureidoglycolate hydrolase